MIARPALQARQPIDAAAAADPPIRLLIVDDSTVARAVLARMADQHADLQVVATAGSVVEALETLHTVLVDIILLDVEMPGGSGLDALPHIVASGRGARVLVVSSLAEKGAETSVKALASGATDTLAKPGAGVFGGRFSAVLADRLRRIGRVDRSCKAGAQSSIPFEPVLLRDPSEQEPACIAIGGSTGGIHAVNDLLGSMRQRIGAPILVTQHLPALFMPYFARQLEVSSGRPARVAQSGDRLQPDQIYVAPGTAHLCIERHGSTNRVKLDARPASSGCLPSVDPMLSSVAEVYGPGGVAVVLSGMGRDGTVGCERLVANGGTVLVQDRPSSAVWGMPRAVAEAGFASAVLPPRDIAKRITSRIGDIAWT